MKNNIYDPTRLYFTLFVVQENNTTFFNYSRGRLRRDASSAASQHITQTEGKSKLKNESNC